SLTAFDVSFSSALQWATSRQRLSSYLDGDAIISGDERRQCALYIENVDQRRLDALGIAWRHFLTVYGGREKVGLRLEGRRNGAMGGAKPRRPPGGAPGDRPRARGPADRGGGRPLRPPAMARRSPGARGAQDCPPPVLP